MSLKMSEKKAFDNDVDALEAAPPIDMVAPEAPSSLDLDSSIVVRITMLANQITSSASLTFQRRHGLTSTEWKVMAVVAAMPESSGADIAQVLSIDKAAISRTVRTLAERDLLSVERKNPLANLQAITLSAQGELLHRQALATAFEREKCLLLDLTFAEQEQVRTLLGRMFRRMPSVFSLAETPVGAFDADAARATNMPDTSETRPDKDVAALRARVARLESLLADLMLENADLRSKGAGQG